MKLTRASVSVVAGDYCGARVQSVSLFSFLFTPFLLLTQTIPPRLPATREQRSLICALDCRNSPHTHTHTRCTHKAKCTQAFTYTHMAVIVIEILSVGYPGVKAGRRS